MSLYTPVIIGDAGHLRVGIESMLSQNASEVAEELAYKTRLAEQIGLSVTFGAEVEFMLPDDPAKVTLSDEDEDSLYMEVVREVELQAGIVAFEPITWPKGKIIRPIENSTTVMLNRGVDGKVTACDDQVGSGIIEIRTSPEIAAEAIERYWRTIQAIGLVAARHGRMGLVLGTHINTALMDHGAGFVSFRSPRGGNFLAAIQHNLNAMNTLQVDAGLDEGTTVLEAFPDSKDASTTVHATRLELRHPSVGVADPRVDMLAVLDGVKQAADCTISGTAIGGLRRFKRVYESSGAWNALAETLSELTLWDTGKGRLAMPATLTHSAREQEEEQCYDTVVSAITGGAESQAFADNGQTLREFLCALHVNQDASLSLDRKSRFFNNVALRIEGTKVWLGMEVLGVQPYVVDDTIDRHLARRRNVNRSSIVRRVMGQSIASLTPAEQSIAIRQQLIDNHMVVLGDKLAEEDMVDVQGAVSNPEENHQAYGQPQDTLVFTVGDQKILVQVHVR